MKMTRSLAMRFGRGGTAVIVASALLAGCAQSPKTGGQTATAGQASGGEAGESTSNCNPVVGAVIGGVAGALIGGDKRRTAGAAVGAGVGALACLAYNYKVRRTKSAEEVADDYRRANGNQLPPVPTVTIYRTDTAVTTARGGDDVTVTSAIEIVAGTKEALKELREEFAVIDPDGVERSKITKTPVSGSQTGAYVSTLQFTFPRGVPPGAYQVQSRLYVNGQPAKSSSVKIQVAAVGENAMIARLADALGGDDLRV